MAHTGRCCPFDQRGLHVPDNGRANTYRGWAMGYADSASAVYIPDKCGSGKDACKRRNCAGALQKGNGGKRIFLKFLNADCQRIAVENPTPMRLVGLPPYTQAIQPYWFGHPYSKRTCLWLVNLPLLKPTCIVSHHEPYVNGGCKDAHGNYRRFQGRNERDPKTRSKTFPGIAQAMAEQWG